MCSIDVDGDGKADLNIDTDGDGKPDKNIDADGDGKVDPVISTSKGDGSEDGDDKTEEPVPQPSEDGGKSDLFDDDDADKTEDGFGDNIVAGVTPTDDDKNPSGANGGAGGAGGVAGTAGGASGGSAAAIAATAGGHGRAQQVLMVKILTLFTKVYMINQVILTSV